MLVPMIATLADGARDNVVLDTAIWPPGANVWPAMTNCEAAFAVYAEPANVNMGRLEAGAGVVRIWVLVPITATLADGARDNVVLDTAIWLPGANVWPAMTNCEAAFAVYAEPANVNMGRLEAGAGVVRIWVLVPITATFAEGARDNVVLDTTIWPPGVSVWPATTN